MAAELACSAYIGNILPLIDTVLTLPFFVFPPVDVVGGIYDPKLIFPPGGAFCIFMSCIKRGSISFDLKDSRFAILKMLIPMRVLVEQGICPAAVFLKNHPPNVVRYKTDGIIINGNAIGFPNDILSGLIGTLILCPIGTPEHECRCHFKWKLRYSKCVIQREDAFDTHGIIKRLFGVRTFWNQHRSAVTENPVKCVDQALCFSVCAKFYPFGLEFPFFRGSVPFHRCSG